MVLFPTAVLALSSAVLCAAQNATNNDFPVNAQNFTSAQYNLSTVDIQYQVWLGCGPADNLTTVNRRVSYFIVGGLAIIDGDIVYGTEDDILNDIVSTNPPTVARDEELRPDKRALSTRNQNERWPNAVVPYAWGNIVEPPDTNPPTPPLTDQDVSDRKAMFQRAAQVWMDKLPWLKIQLVDDPFPTDAAPAAGIRIDFLTGCVSWSPVGRKPAQVDSVVSIGCPSLNVYVHELGHSE
jgi:hypothetical protein